MPLRSPPSRKIILRDSPPCRLIQCRTVVGINIPQRARAHRAGDGPAVTVGHPGGVETEAGVFGGADLVVRDQTQHQRAGGEAVAVDHDVFAGRAQHGEGLQVVADLAAAVLGNAHGRRCRQNGGRQQGGAQNQAANSHDPRPRLNLYPAFSRRRVWPNSMRKGDSRKDLVNLKGRTIRERCQVVAGTPHFDSILIIATQCHVAGVCRAKARFARPQGCNRVPSGAISRPCPRSSTRARSARKAGHAPTGARRWP